MIGLLVPTSAVASLPTILKRETEALHQKIEADLNLLNPELDLGRYRMLLERFLGYYEPWERAVDSFDPELLAARSKCGRLKQDLHFLGGSHHSIKECSTLPQMRSRTEVLGSMYVIEGATLGGQILHRHFQQKFDFGSAGCGFFGGYGPRTGEMWRRFLEVLSSVPEAQTDIAVGSAKATFESMHDWLCL